MLKLNTEEEKDNLENRKTTQSTSVKINKVHIFVFEFSAFVLFILIMVHS